MLKLISFTAIAACFFGISWGQTTANSPFSSYGIGEYGNIYNAQFSGLANITGVSTDTTVLNPYNPSGYALLSQGQPLFGLGVLTKISFYKLNEGKQTSLNTNITNFTLAVPFSKHFGLGGGIMPYTRRGYSIGTRQFVYDDTLNHQYQGSGSINNGFIGFSYAPIKTNRTELSFGVQGSFLFGNVSNTRLSFYDNTVTDGGIQVDSKRVKSFSYTLGLTFRQYLDIDKKQELVFGTIFSPQTKLNAYLDYGLYSASDVTDYSTYDTLSEISNNKGKITMPSCQVYTIGYSYKPKTTENKLNSIYCLGVYGELEVMNWKNYQENFTNYSYSGYSNTIATRFAIQFQPNTDIQTKTKGLAYFNKVKYRLGTYYAQNPMMYNGKQYATTAVTFGMGLPFLAQKSNSSLNLGIQYGKTSNGVAGDLREQFLSISIGIIIAPSSYERWFRKYKLD